jgi:hypothetical protein
MPGRFIPPPVRAADMARVCRALAADMRREAARGLPSIGLAFDGHLPYGQRPMISRAEAAASIERQAERWEEELRTGVCNVVDRVKLGEPVW